MSKFSCAVQQLRDLAEDVRPFFTDGKPREGLDLPDNAPDELEVAAAFLELAGKIGSIDLEILKRDLQSGLREMTDPTAGEIYLMVNRPTADAYKKLIPLIEAIPEDSDG